MYLLAARRGDGRLWPINPNGFSAWRRARLEPHPMAVRQLKGHYFYQCPRGAVTARVVGGP